MKKYKKYLGSKAQYLYADPNHYISIGQYANTFNVLPKFEINRTVGATEISIAFIVFYFNILLIK